ncbi:MAG: GTP-binding protein [Thermoleophilia bacterium]
MKLIVLAGFLGSGKTTLLLEIARDLVAGGSTVAVIENEIGEIGIDGDYIAEQGLEVRELFGGCICCTLAVGVVDALATLARDHNPDYVLLEPSGIAQPGDLSETVRRYASAVDGVVTVTLIDAERYEVLTEVVGPMLEGQMAQADVIAVTKSDLVPEVDLTRILATVGELAPGVPVEAVSLLDSVSLMPVLARLR